MSDYYKILGIDPGVSPADIKLAYRRLALKFHPDHNSGNLDAARRFHLIGEAYGVLASREKRSFYDRFGVDREALVHSARSTSPVQAVEGFVTGVLDEMLGRRKKSVSGKDHRYTLEIGFVDAALGCEREIEVPRIESCGSCSGSGGAGEASIEACHVCEGAGEVRASASRLSLRKACEFCQGKGEVVTQACEKCGGEGRASNMRVLSICVPPGARDGQRLRYRGAGGTGVRGGTDGDLYVVLFVEDDALFRRRGHHVDITVPVTVREALLGTSLVVPTLDGPVRLKVPAGSQTRDKLRIAGRGIPRPSGNGRGDAFVIVDVELPIGPRGTLEPLTSEWAALGDDAHPRRSAFRAAVDERCGPPGDKRSK